MDAPAPAAAIVENPDALPLDPPLRRQSTFKTVADAVLGFLILLVCFYVGEALRRWGHVPLPGTVIGLALLAGGLTVLSRIKIDRPAECVEPAARALVTHMGLLFVPAGAGIMMQATVLRAQWLPIVVALVGSTWIGLASTGWLMQRVQNRSRGSDIRDAS